MRERRGVLRAGLVVTAEVPQAGLVVTAEVLQAGLEVTPAADSGASGLSWG